ncbi:MAG: glycosyltransferase family 4 protein [Solirubrobacteraceae bacterium]
MRLLAVSTLGEVAGGESTLLRALPALRRRGYAPRLAVPSGGDLRKAARERDVPTVRIPLGPPERFTPAALIGMIAAPPHLARCDVVWLNGPPTQRLLPALALTGRRAVLRVNNPLSEPPAWWRRPGYWRIVQVISVPSQATADECLAAGAPEERIHVMPPPGWEEGRRPVPARRSDNGALRIGFVGTIEARKGVLELIRAADEFLDADPRATLTVIGAPRPQDRGGYAQQVRDAVTAARTGDRIELRGYVPDARSVIAELDVLVIPSHQEPMATVTSEAAAAGVPIVATRVGGLPEGVGDGGILVPPGDPRALAEAVRSLLDDPARRRALAERALAGAGRFDPAAFAETMDGLLRGAVQAAR